MALCFLVWEELGCALLGFISDRVLLAGVEMVGGGRVRDMISGRCDDSRSLEGAIDSLID